MSAYKPKNYKLHSLLNKRKSWLGIPNCWKPKTNKVYFESSKRKKNINLKIATHKTRNWLLENLTKPEDYIMQSLKWKVEIIDKLKFYVQKKVFRMKAKWNVFKIYIYIDIYIVFQSWSHIWVFATPWPAACQASLSFTISWSLLRLMSIESVMPSNQLILCCPLLLL